MTVKPAEVDRLPPSRSSRSLGRLLGVGSLWLAPLGTHPSGDLPPSYRATLDQPGPAAIISVGADRATPGLALATVSAGRNLVVVVPSDDHDPHRLLGWLSALGVPVVFVAASRDATLEAASKAARVMGATLIVADAGDGAGGLPSRAAVCGDTAGESIGCGGPDLPTSHQVSADILADAVVACQASSILLATGAADLVGAERVRALVVAGRSQTLALPFDDLAAADQPLAAIVGTLPAPLSPPVPQVWDERDGVLVVPVTDREVRAMQRLLAREEGILASETGASGLAAVLKALAADRARKLRERRLGTAPSIMALFPQDGDGWPPGPPLADDIVDRAAAPPGDLSRVLMSECRAVRDALRPGEIAGGTDVGGGREP